ncbi:hypothetical protein D0C36_04225 [Mucilaginibacter conchicola]|uniref:Uncharacterized protein n=2 Tax=Mucilaginibacter conchicola TaxID=2303333 RepID=A0A372NXC0_9SPHI|nr:hypothetical protein D0C36_04225 [Mucilaginibacter conchicola]
MMLCMLPLLMAACKKDKSEKASGLENYYIRGTMKSVIAADGGAESPFVMTFDANRKASLVNINGINNLNYTVTKDRITLSDNGYFNLQNKQITDWTIAGMNITSAMLLPVGANQLRGKNFEGTIKYSKLNFDAPMTVYFNKGANSVSFDKIAGTQVYDFVPYAGVATYMYDIPSASALFMMYKDGKLAVVNTGSEVGFGSTELNAK